jgi:hypothetical protein
MKSWLTPSFILNHAALPLNLFPQYAVNNPNGIRNFITPLFLILKAALQDSLQQINMQAPPTEWKWLISNLKWRLLPFLFVAIRCLNRYEVSCRVLGEVDRGLKVFKVSPLPNNTVPSKNSFC